jgi:hypothetical protein
MSHERLIQFMQARQDAIAAGQEPLMAQETILSIFRALDQGDITEGRALRLLRYQAMRLADEPAHAALSRQAAADTCQMQREVQ